MAQSASLILLCLIVESWRCRCPSIHRQGVALETEEIHLAALQQAGIRRTMRRMARCTAFGFHHRVFVNERTGFVGVAFEANRVLCCRRAQLPRQISAVRIVTVIALHETFVHTVMKCLRELLLCLQMATVTKLRLLLLHEDLTLLGIVR